MGNHVLALKANPNKNGKDHVIGDVHGGLGAFKDWLANITKENRGICAGDLVDRGEDSLGIILAIKEHNENENNGHVYAICGNHEMMCLKAVKELESHVNDIVNRTTTMAKLIKIDYSAAANYDVNGGEWMLKLFEKEVSEKKIYTYYDQESKSEKVLYADDSDVKKVIDYFNSLPIEISVEEDFANNRMPYNVVHADMPVSDNEIHFMIREGQLKFDDAQINYATWARPSEFVARGRNENSVLTLVGHNIVTLVLDHAVLPDTNVVGLDFKSHQHKAIISVNVTDMKCEWFGNLNDKRIHPVSDFNIEFESINQHLLNLKELCNYLAKFKKSNNYDQLKVAILGEQFTEKKLLDMAIRHQALSEKLIKDELITGRNLEKIFNAGFDYRYRFSDGMSLENFVEKSDTPCKVAYRLIQQEKLYEAIKSVDIKKIERALEDGANVFHVNSDGETVFDVAQAAGCLQDVINRSATHVNQNQVPIRMDLSEDLTTGWSELHIAALSGRQDVYDKAAELLFDPNKKATIPRVVFNKLILFSTLIDNSILTEEFASLGATHGDITITPAEIMHYIHVLDAAVRDKCNNDEELLQCLKDGKIPYHYTFQDGTSLLSLAEQNKCGNSFRAIMVEQLSQALVMNYVADIRSFFATGVQLGSDTLNGTPIFHLLINSKCILNWTDDHTLALTDQPDQELNEPAKILRFVFDEIIRQLYDEPDVTNKALATFHERVIVVGEYVIVRPNDIIKLKQEIATELQSVPESVINVHDHTIFSHQVKAEYEEDADRKDKNIPGQFNLGQ